MCLGRRPRPLRRSPERSDAIPEFPEPAQPVLPRDGCVCGRGRGEDEECGLAQPSRLRAELRALAEGAAIGLLPHEPDRARAQLERDPLQALGGTGEIGPAEVAGAGSRPRGRVRDPEAEREQFGLLARLEATRCEPGRVEQPPEVVARVREVRVRLGGEPARVDPAEDRRQPAGENIGNVGFRLLQVLWCRACPRTGSAGARRTPRTRSAAVAPRRSRPSRSLLLATRNTGRNIRPRSAHVTAARTSPYEADRTTSLPVYG